MLTVVISQCLNYKSAFPNILDFPYFSKFFFVSWEKFCPVRFLVFLHRNIIFICIYSVLHASDLCQLPEMLHDLALSYFSTNSSFCSWDAAGCSNLRNIM